jgi:2'-5' RNA ligase
MRRIAQKLRLPFGFLSEMTYRPPKSISAGRFLTLAAAHDECIQRRKYREEREAFHPHTALGRLAAKALDYLDREEAGDMK